ncbi:N-methyl-L-tryptophan oxidase [Luedemannella helvata]|uniref:N-methyl-L-tryptophan oxidase n=1 Tax=Luedemannella helvata TaxID=349315 RepID=UPI0031CE25AD
MRPKVIVVGLGTMGAAAAWRLASRGASVLGLDRFAPPHGRGAHAGGTRIIRMVYMEGADYVPLVRRAYPMWRAIEAATGTSLLTPTSALMLGRPGAAAVAGSAAAAHEHDLAHELLDAAEVRRRFPAFTPAADEVGVYERAAGMLRPEAAIEAMLGLARDAGADLRTGVEVTGWRAGPDGVTVRTGEGEHRADRLVLAPGAWAGRLLDGLDVPLRVERRVQHYWRPAGPDAFAPDRFPVWIWDAPDGSTGYGVGAVDGAVKAAMHSGAGLVDPDLGADPATAVEVAAMRDWLAPRVPGLAAAGWAGAVECLYTLTPDTHFVLGHHPGHTNVAVACGFSGHGFKFAPVVGDVLADLTLTGGTDAPVALFDPRRFGRAGVTPVGADR